jgi:leader peptidase (prepilin peptidase) / N-methyltransferase
VFVFYFLSFIFGSAIGSFVQVVASRFNVAPIIKAYSKCLSCGEALAPLDLVPVLSYLFLFGKCRYCKSKFGILTLLVELLYGIVFVLLYHFILAVQVSLIASTIWLVYYTLLFTALGIIALYDYAHTYIPAPFLFFYCFLTLLMLMFRFVYSGSSVDFLSPVIVALPFFLIWIITKGRGLGFGDVLLFLGVGAFFGISQGLSVLIISIWLGAIVGVGVYFKRKIDKIKSTAIPFVPFIVIAFLFVLFTDIDIFSIARIFS